MKPLPSKSEKSTKSDRKPIRSHRKIFQVDTNVRARNGNELKSDVNVRLEGAAPPPPIGALQSNHEGKSPGNLPGQIWESKKSSSRNENEKILICHEIRMGSDLSLKIGGVIFPACLLIIST